jgi:hypothetical protein
MQTVRPLRPLWIGKRPIVAIQAMDAGKLLDPFFAGMPGPATGRKPLIENPRATSRVRMKDPPSLSTL